MKQRNIIAASIVAAGLGAFSANAISFDEIQFWTGTGTNRAAMVIEWSAPEVSSTVVPAPISTKAMVWGYRFNGVAKESDMLNAIIAADPKLYVMADISIYGTFVEAIGYNLSADGNVAVTDGTNTHLFTNGLLTTVPYSKVDTLRPVNPGDLYWGGLYGPNWELWHEQGGMGGFESSPKRGTSPFWTCTNTNSYSEGYHGEWQLAAIGLNSVPLVNGSWVGFTVGAGSFDDSEYYRGHKQAPFVPEGGAVAYVFKTNDFATEIVSSSELSPISPYNQPSAVLGRPTTKFYDYYGDGKMHRVKMFEPPYYQSPEGSNLLTSIDAAGQITVKMGRKVYDDPNNAYGVDLILYGNSFYTATSTADLNDNSDLQAITLSGSIGYSTKVSVSQDGVTWYTYTPVSLLYPQNAYRWDADNHAWSDEFSNPTKPLNPSLYGASVTGQNAASFVGRFMGAAGGTGFDLKESGLPWVQYVRVQAGNASHTVLDSIAAVNPTPVGDSLLMTPGNLTAGLTNVVFQNPANLSQSLVSLGFSALGADAKVSAVSFNEVSAYAPVKGNVSSGYKLAVQPLSGSGPVVARAELGLSPSPSYGGNGADLLVYQWNGTNWENSGFTYNTSKHLVQLGQVTNFNAFVIAQLPPVRPQVKVLASGIELGFVPVAGKHYTVERSTNLVDWTTIKSIDAASDLPLSVVDAEAPKSAAFYRVRFGH